MSADPIRSLNLCGQCKHPVRIALAADTSLAKCGHCGAERDLEAGAIADGRLVRCPWCGCPELYRQRDFHQTLGCAIMTVAAIASVIVHQRTGSWWWLVILAVGVAIDAVLYRVVPDRAGCYVCHAEFRAVPNLAEIKGYDLQDATRIEYSGPRREQLGDDA